MSQLITSRPGLNTYVRTIQVTKDPKDHALFAYTKRGRGYRKVRVSGWMTYTAALERFSRAEAYHQRSIVQDPLTAPLGAGGGPVLHLAVRSKQDPNWNRAARSTLVQRATAARKHRAAVRAI